MPDQPESWTNSHYLFSVYYSRFRELSCGGQGYELFKQTDQRLDRINGPSDVAPASLDDMIRFCVRGSIKRIFTLTPSVDPVPTGFMGLQSFIEAKSSSLIEYSALSQVDAFALMRSGIDVEELS